MCETSLSLFLFMFDSGFSDPTAVLEDFSGELGSAQWDTSGGMDTSDCKQETGSELPSKSEGSFNKLSSSCHPLSVNNEIHYAIQHPDSALVNYHCFPQNHPPNWLSLSTLDYNPSSMDLVENSFGSLMNQQLQNNLPNCNTPLDNAEGEGLLYSSCAGFGNDFYSDNDQEDFEQMRGKIYFNQRV